jgi:hypothetical protein
MSLIISNQNQTVTEYIKNAAIRSKNTAIVYQSRLLYFSKYTNETIIYR